MLNAEKKERILNVLIEKRGVQNFIQEASKILGNPLVLSDISGKILAKSQDRDLLPTRSALAPCGPS